MRLTKLEINGFKSFARKTEFKFDNGITAVIGPNGSGKSNIADAVRWVLGEQSAKALRGTKMEDVIFNGTETRKAQGYCEVALTFDNTDGRLPMDFAEITVTRRVYRSGESEYMINRANCRLKDIHTLFRDTGIGKEGYSIIGQGKVEEILSNKSSDRRNAFEEAAGIMGYRARKEETVRKLEQTEKNLTRLTDILSELEVQLDPLKEQSEAAKAFFLMRDEMKDLELNVFLAQYDKLTERIEGYEKTIEALIDEEKMLTGTETQLRTLLESKQDIMQSLEQTAGVLQSELLSMMSEAKHHEGELNVIEERISNLEREEERLKAELEIASSRSESLKDELHRLSGGKDESEERKKALLEQIESAERKKTELDARIEEVENTLEKQKASIMESMNRLSDAKSNLSRLDAMKNAYIQRLDAIKAGQETFIKTDEELISEKKLAEDEKAVFDTQTDELRNEAAKIKKNIDDAARNRIEAQKRVHMLEQEKHAQMSRANVLKEMSAAHEGYYASVRNVMRDTKRNAELFNAIKGVVAELLDVPKEYETALEMTLGSALQNIVTPTPEDAKYVINHLRMKQYGRATMLPMSSMRPKTLNNDERRALNMHGCIGVASELIGYDDEYRNVVENLLGRTVIVENLDAGIAINKQMRSAFRIATLQGDIINPGGSMTGGSVQKREYSLLGREREIKELQERIVAIEGKIEAAKREEGECMKREGEMSQALIKRQETLHERDIESMRQNEKLELIDRDIQKNASDAMRLKLEQEQIEDNIADIEQEREKSERLSSGIQEGNAASQEDVQASQRELSSLRELQEEQGEVLTDLRISHMALEKEDDAAKRDIERIKREMENANTVVEKNASLREANEKEKDELIKKREVMGVCIEEEREKLGIRKDEQQAHEDERIALSTELKEARMRLDEISSSLRENNEKKHRQEMGKSRVEMEKNTMQDRIWEDYELTYENTLPFRKNIVVTAAHLRIDSLKESIRALGNINPNAVEDYETVYARHTELTTQCDDVIRAKDDLTKLIEELTATMEKRFIERFELIQKNFGEVFTKLFGGGHAMLRLADENDVLNCDIDIIAQPPGKKLSMLTLLSGGERAFTAIALLFAMLKLKPAAFCILDEIEASLDEVNVSRFANYLLDYSSDTQFILITHRKGSMEVCNALYGVAMEEKGVSKVVSARFV